MTVHEILKNIKLFYQDNQKFEEFLDGYESEIYDNTLVGGEYVLSLSLADGGCAVIDTDERTISLNGNEVEIDFEIVEAVENYCQNIIYSDKTYKNFLNELGKNTHWGP